MRRFSPQLWLFSALALVTVSLGCKKDEEPNKIIFNFPVNVSQRVIPAEMIRLSAVLKRDGVGIVVKGMNTMAQDQPNFSQFSGPDGSSQYTFNVVANSYHPQLVYTVQFRTDADGVIDPIASEASTTSLKYASISLSGGTPEFTYSEDLRLVLNTAGDVTSPKKTLGTTRIQGLGYDLTLTLDPLGAPTNAEGLTQGDVDVSGTGPSGPVTGTLSYSSNHDLDGTLTWEGNTGQIHIDNAGPGFVIVDNTFIPFE